MAAIEEEEQFQKLCHFFILKDNGIKKSISGIKGGYRYAM